MKRRLFKLALFLILGAIVNVGVSWWCELSTDTLLTIGEIKLDQDEAIWPSYLNDLNLPLPVVANLEIVEGVGISFIEIRSFPRSYQELLSLGKDEMFLLDVIKCGWPLRSMVVHRFLFIGPQKDEKMEEIFGLAGWYTGFVPPESFPVTGPRGGHHLPIMLIPGAFILNTLLYTIILWITLAGPVILYHTSRRCLRIKRGLCIKCGYNLRGGSEQGCPECGWGRDIPINSPAKSIEKQASDPS